MAERVYDRWRREVEVKREKGVKRMVKVIEENCKEKERCALIRLLTTMTLVQPNRKDKTNKENNEQEITDHNLNQYSSRTLKSKDTNMEFERYKANTQVFDKLNSEAITRQEALKKRQQIKQAQELKDCRFKPKIKSSNHSFDSNGQSVYERLFQKDKQEKEKAYEKQKRMNEIKGCTFRPKVLTNKRSVEPAFSRLHKHAEVIEQTRKIRELSKKEKELDQCTFVPSVNLSMNGTNRESSADRFKRLYDDYAERKRRLTKKALNKEEEEREAYTFRPHIEKANRSFKENEEILPRYEKLYKHHSQQKKLLEEKKRELEEEEKKLQILHIGKRQTSDVPFFDRLLDQGKAYKKKRDELAKKLMEEMGISFTPRIDINSIQMSESDSRGIIKRNEDFLKVKEKKISKQVPTELRECTFAPRLSRSQIQTTQPTVNKEQAIGERLYSYFEQYEH